MTGGTAGAGDIVVTGPRAQFLLGDIAALQEYVDRFHRMRENADSDVLDAADDVATVAAAFAGRVERALTGQP